LDAAYIIPAAEGFPDLPAAQAQDGTLKLDDVIVPPEALSHA